MNPDPWITNPTYWRICAVVARFGRRAGLVAAVALAVVLIEAVTRLVPGVVKEPESVERESFGPDGLLDFPQYTGLPDKKIENGGEVAALKGTSVSVIAKLNAGAKSARLVMNDGTKVEMSAGSDNQFIGQFAVKKPQ